MSSIDATWPDTAIFACPCGTVHPVTYWRWVDVVARPELAEQVRTRGPFEGQCPECSATPRATATWLAIDSDRAMATLIVSEDRRGDIIDELEAHLRSLRGRSHAITSWVLSPQLEFVARADENTARRMVSSASTDGSQPGVVAPVSSTMRSGELVVAPDAPEYAMGSSPEVRSAAPMPTPVHQTEPARMGRSTPLHGRPGTPGVPQVIGSDLRTPHPAPPPSLGAINSDLQCIGGVVTAPVEVPAETVEKWSHAKLEVRPVHLRGRGYPLIGIRVIAAFMGQQGCIDALLDAGGPLANEVFRALSQDFIVRLKLRSATGEPITREVRAEGLGPNAALCIESARSLLARGEYPPEEFDKARQALAAESVEQRLAPSDLAISPGAYEHVVGAREAITALEHLDRISHKEALSRLLEVEGLPVGEYDKIRRRVLAGSLEHGLIAPRRFWRRVTASGLADDYADYAARLASNRAAHEGEEGDLSAEQALTAWEEILDLCQRKNLPIPPEVRAALDLGDDSFPASGLGHAFGGSFGTQGIAQPGDDGELAEQLRDPSQRLKVAADILQGARGGNLDLVFAALEAFDPDELLAILPDLSDLGARATAGLLPMLGSPRRELRQAAVILLGLSLDSGALDPLADALVREETNVWLDVARALGAFGPVALRNLCQILHREARTPLEHRSIQRVARALAEIALSDGPMEEERPTPGRDAVAALAEAADPRVCAAARRALATLADVSESGAAMRGELPPSEVTEIRGFARRAYEAIMVPELEVEAEA